MFVEPRLTVNSMPRLVSLFLVSLGLVHPTVAQTDSTWHADATGKMAFTQAGFYRWHDGGTSSLALSAGLTAEFTRSGINVKQSHAFRLAYGVVKQNASSLRKAEDLLHIRSAFTLLAGSFDGRFQPAVTVDFRSQFADGFAYNAPRPEGTPAPRISAFLSPATLTQSLGLNYEAVPWAQLRSGLAAKETIVAERKLRPRYKVQENQSVRWEAGLSGLILIDTGLFTNVHMKHSLQVFASFNQVGAPDLLSETLITMKVNRWLQVNAEYTAQLDRDVSRSVQMKELISLAFAVSLL